MDKAQQVYDAATEGGYNISGPALAVAIRTALKVCCDDNGKLNLSELYELTCKLERIKE